MFTLLICFSHALGVSGSVDGECGTDAGGQRSVFYAAEDT